MLCMADNRTPKPRGRGRPKGRKMTYPIQARVDRPLYAALTALSQREKRSKSVLLYMGLELLLRQHGLWPPPDATP
jgi:hypothetical protein